MTSSKVITLLLLVLTVCFKSNGQALDSTIRKGTIITLDCPPKMNDAEVLMIISINRLQAEVTLSELARDSVDLNPDWIKSLNVLRGGEATEYGERGKFGVILLELKSESFDQLPADLKIKFKMKD